jgi:predicted PurR-regulated permease PerM
MTITFNNRIKQILTLVILISLVLIVVKSLQVFIPGILGAVTLYILSRERYFQMLYKRKRKPGLSAMVFILFYLVLFGIPIYLAVTLISPKIESALVNPTATIDSLKNIVTVAQQKIGYTFVSEKNIAATLSKLANVLPGFINSTANLVTNLAIMLFLLYHMLVNARQMEHTLYNAIPLKDNNVDLLAREGKKVVKANALGLPIIAIIQGVTATIGYIIFGVPDWGLWGFLTAICAFVPVVGTMIIWIPLVCYLFAIGQNNMAIGLLLYSLVVTGNVDYLARITIMKKMGDVHPIITILGVIVGFNLFGFIGLIFGPLIINYTLVLFKIYMNEYVEVINEADDDDEKEQ